MSMPPPNMAACPATACRAPSGAPFGRSSSCCWSSSSPCTCSPSASRLTTADKCGGEHFDDAEDMEATFPPQWECTSRGRRRDRPTTGSSRSPTTSGAAYLRYSFTKGTEQEVDVPRRRPRARARARVLDVGCGPGGTPTPSPRAASRSSASTSRNGSSTSPRSARRRRPATFVRLDARQLAVRRRVRRRHLALPGRLRARWRPATRLTIDGRARPAWPTPLRPSGRVAVSRLLVVLPGALPRGQRTLRRRHRRAPRAHRAARTRRASDARGGPLDHVLTPRVSSACSLRSRGSARSTTSGRSTPGRYGRHPTRRSSRPRLLVRGRRRPSRDSPSSLSPSLRLVASRPVLSV